jgi:predicted ATPase/DNA-binding SARP family transcriptional activator
MNTEPLWRIECFGGLRAVSAERTVERFRSQKTGALLAYLAFHREQAHSREILLDMFWQESELPDARRSLRVALSSLRSQLEPPGMAAGSVLIADNHRVQFNPALLTTDVALFEHAIQDAAEAESRPEQIAHLARAVDLYRGPLLPGYYESWIPPQQAHLEEAYMQAVRRLIENLQGRGEPERAIRYALQAATVDPFWEEIHYALIHLYITTGRHAEALQQYEYFAQLLRDRLDEAPSPALIGLAEQLRNPASHPPISDTESRTPHKSWQGNRASLQAGSPPAGTLTFLLVDVLNTRTHTARRTGWAHLQGVLREICRQHGGSEIRREPESFAVTFGRVQAACACAIACQQAVGQNAGSKESLQPHVRMVLHTGDVGTQTAHAIARAEQALLAAHGGQLLCTEETALLLRNRPPHPPNSESEIQLVDCGLYRLSEGGQPERIFQIRHPSLIEVDSPPLKAALAFQGSLPPSTTRLFGREQEIERLASSLLKSGKEPPIYRLWTLTGPGGSGKTRLAMAVAGQLWEPLRGAVWFVPIADLSDPEQVPDAIYRAMRLPDAPHAGALDRIIHVLGSQPSLLILDNYEQLLPGGAGTVHDLLSCVPGLRCLVTSRQLLSISDEHEFPVHPLPVVLIEQSGPSPSRRPNKHDEKWLADLLEIPSIGLFVDRAQAVKPDFRLTKANSLAVADLCRQLEGLPLAIELAAARITVLSPAQMLERFYDRFNWLTSRRRDLPERHQTLRSAIDWSYDLLSPEIQKVFLSLAVFRGGWTLEAAEAVCQDQLGTGGMIDVLQSLIECSLIRREEGEEPPRFRMLESLREYALERLGEQTCRQIAGKHAHYYATLAKQTEELMRGSEQSRWLHYWQSEHENVRAALQYCLENADAETGLRLATALLRHWRVHTRFEEGYDWMQRLLEAGQIELSLHAKTLYCMAWIGINTHMDPPLPNRVLVENALQRYREREDPRGIAAALQLMGAVLHKEQRNTEAVPLLEEAVRISRALYDKHTLAWCFYALQYAAGVVQPETQYDYLKEAIEILREVEDAWGLQQVLHARAETAWGTGEYEEARLLLKEGLPLLQALGDRASYALLCEAWTLFQAVGDRIEVVSCLRHLADNARLQGDYDAARAYLEEGKRFLHPPMPLNDFVRFYEMEATLDWDLGELQAAQQRLEHAVALWEAHPDSQKPSFTSLLLGFLAIDQGDFERAHAILDVTLSYWKHPQQQVNYHRILFHLGRLALLERDLKTAHKYLTQSAEFRHRTGNRVELATALETLAELAFIKNDSAQCATLLQEATALRETIGAPPSPFQQQKLMAF